MSKLPVLTSVLFFTSCAYAESHTNNHFTPHISVILNGYYYHDNQQGTGSDILENMAGIRHGVHTHAHGEVAQGFNLGESELLISALANPHFDSQMTLTIAASGEIALEEAWLQTRLWSNGLKLKMGKFLSGIGYQNSQHHHEWDFTDQNLAYLGLFGGDGLKDTGIQLTWVAPTPFYAMLGAEALQGDDQELFGALVDHETAHATTAIADPLPKLKAGPRITTVFAKFAPDLGHTQALQLGLSYAKAKQYQRLVNDDDIAQSADEFAADGTQQLLGVDALYTWNSARPFGQGDITLSAEYLRLKHALNVSSAGSHSGVNVDDNITSTQDGYYVQASYGIAPRWQLAVRQDANGLNSELNQGTRHVSLKPSSRQSILLSFSPSEFSRLRLQLAQGDMYDNANPKTALKQVFLHYTHHLETDHERDH